MQDLLPLSREAGSNKFSLDCSLLVSMFLGQLLFAVFCICTSLSFLGPLQQTQVCLFTTGVCSQEHTSTSFWWTASGVSLTTALWSLMNRVIFLTRYSAQTLAAVVVSRPKDALHIFIY